MTLTSAYQLVPEQSTAALVVHHPEAKYYAVRGASAAADAQPAAMDQTATATTAGAGGSGA